MIRTESLRKAFGATTAVDNLTLTVGQWRSKASPAISCTRATSVP